MHSFLRKSININLLFTLGILQYPTSWQSDASDMYNEKQKSLKLHLDEEVGNLASKVRPARMQ